ncbi:MAG: thiamine phosphate synthase [Haloarculaceae archaeon]
MTALETYLVTQADLSAGRTTPEVVAAAIDGGVDVVQVREKHRSAREQLAVARELRELTREAEVALVVNDRVDVATAAGADGVHLGDDDLPVEAAREQLGPDALIGRSVSTVEAAREAEAAGADYLGVGALFPTGSKDVPDEEGDLGLDVVRAVDDAVEIPFVGIGGITPENAADVVSAGADGVAVISAITATEDPEAATRRLGEAVVAGTRRRAEGGDAGAATDADPGGKA